MHAQRPPTQSMAPQQSTLDRHALPAVVQQRIVARRMAQCSPLQHCASPAHTLVLPGPKHVAVVGAQRPVVQAMPGQQSVFDAHVSVAPRHTQ